MKYDCIVVGGGVVGAAVVDRLAAFDISILLLEKGDDVAVGASRANSGIVHAGYDCEPNTQKSMFNIRGNKLMWNLIEQLHVPHSKCGSIVVASKNQLDALNNLKSRGDINGVETVILDRAQTLAIEPNIADNIEYALYAPEAGIVCPYRLTISMIDRAITNGAEVLTNAEVTGISKNQDKFVVDTTKGQFEASIVINCAGAYGAAVNDMAGAEHYVTEFKRGDYFVLDNTERKNVNTVIFPLPTAAGKGILVAPTADGNVIYGPTSIGGKIDDTASTLNSLAEIRASVPLTYKSANFAKCIRVYSGNRTIIGHDFVVGKSNIIQNFVMAIGICSPGLTSAPAIAEEIENIVSHIIKLQIKQNYVTVMPNKLRLTELSASEICELVKADESWGRIVCRCEKITEAEIVEAIHSPLLATTVDAVKRRTRAGMGRCQGGFCGVRVMQILARELNLPLSAINKGGEGSEIAVVKVGEAYND